MSRCVYLVLLWLALPWIVLRLWWRGRRESGYRVAFGERFGCYPRPAPGLTTPRIWLHAVSLGETRAARPLLRALATRYPGHRILLTHMTATGRDAALDLAEEEPALAARLDTAWLPYDYPFAVRAFLRRHSPAIGLLMETEVWPMLVRECRRAGVPLLLINARLSARSERGYRRIAWLARPAFAGLSAVLAQTESDARRLAGLGARAVEVSGNLKFDAARPDPEAGRALRRAWAADRVFVAASTRDGEEAMLLDALSRQPLEGVLTAIVPRHPQRFDEVAAMIRAHGFDCVRRSENRPVPAGAVLLGDSLGEMPAYFSAADVAFVGGSLVALGGQNLIEACAAGVPVLIGPHTFNFAQAAEEAVSAGAALRVGDADECIRLARELLQDPQRRHAAGKAGIEFCDRHRGASERTLRIVDRFLAARMPD